MTYIEEYYNKIMSGEIVACHRIKQVYSIGKFANSSSNI